MGHTVELLNFFDAVSTMFGGWLLLWMGLERLQNPKGIIVLLNAIHRKKRKKGLRNKCGKISMEF